MTFDWLPFLTQWSQEILNAEKSRIYDFPQEVIDSGWLGFRGATDEQIRAAEARLKITLPPSYREFLKVTNGWRTTGTCCVTRWFSVEEIDWHYDTNQDEIDSWIEGERLSGGPMPDKAYFVYGEDQHNMVRGEHFKATLEISELNEGSVYLLNPLVVNSDGEWEAWFFADWIPGAVRYRSFWELMQGEYKAFQQQESHKAKRHKREDLASLPNKIPGLVEELSNKIQQRREFIAKATSQPTDSRMYYNGEIAGLELVIEKVKLLAGQTPDPHQLLLELRGLIEEIEKQRENLPGMVTTSPAYNTKFKLDRKNNPNYFADMGRSGGFSKAVGILRWFLNDDYS